MTKAKLLAFAGCASLCACTGTPHREAATDRWQGEVDVTKVNTVDRWALDHGATVLWLKYPQKIKTGDGG